MAKGAGAGRIALIAVLTAVLALLLWALPDEALTFEFLSRQRQQLLDWRDAEPLAPLLFGLLYVALAALGVPAAALLTLAAGALFGFWLGLLIASVSSTLGAVGSLAVARYLLRDWVRRRFPDAVARVDRGIHREGAFYLFALRLVPLFPYFVINLVLGLTAMRIWTFTWVSWIGMLAGTVVYVNAGTQLARIESLEGILSPELLFAFALLGVLPLVSRRVLGALRRHRIYQDWDKPERFDANLIVIGAGSGGLVAAYAAAAANARVILIERGEMGGDCLNTGCVPSKALLRAAHLAGEMRQGARLGVSARGVDIDYPAVLAHVRHAIATIAPKDSVARYRSLGVDVRTGSARLTSPWTVEVDGETVTGRAIVIASGATPAVPPITGLDKTPFLTTDTLWELDELPEHLLLIGGGAVGCELAQAFAQLGSRVTLVELAAQLLPAEDDDVAAMALDMLRLAGVDVRLGRAVASVGEGRADLDDGDCVSFSHLLIAAGRQPSVADLGLEALGLEFDDGGALVVDEHLRTRMPNILGCGDVIAGPRLTHAASHEAWYAAVNGLLGGSGGLRCSHRATPAVVYTAPEIARVGLNEREARAQGRDFEVERLELAELDRAVADAATSGFVKVLVSPGGGRVMGATVVAPRAGEMIGDYVLAVRGKWSHGKLLSAIRPYPSYAEAARHLAGAWQKKRTSPRLLALLGRYFAWRRA